MKLHLHPQIVAAWKTLRARALNAESLRQAFTRNVALKILSLGIAFGLWAFVNFGERDTEASVRVPLELRNLNANLMITSPRLEFVDVRVTGPRTLLGRLDKNRLSIGLDLTGVRPGPASFRVGAESLNLPRGVRVVRVNPSQVSIEIEKVAQKTVPVELRLVGKLAADLQIADTKVAPEAVQVTGPASDVENVHTANTETIDLNTVSPGTIERELPLEAAGDYTSFSAARVAAQVRIEEVSITRDFRGVAVELRNQSASLKIVPPSVRLTLRGPRRLLGTLELPPGSVYIDAEDDGAKERSVKPEIDLPQGIQVVNISPAELKLVRVEHPSRAAPARKSVEKTQGQSRERR